MITVLLLLSVKLPAFGIEYQGCITSFWSKLHVYRNIVKRGKMEHEMTLFHAIEPIKKCFVPDTFL